MSLPPEWVAALHVRRDVLEAEIKERQAELAQVAREINNLVLGPKAEARRRELTLVRPWRTAPRNPPHWLDAHEARRDEQSGEVA